jgi:hypothetical protein
MLFKGIKRHYTHVTDGLRVPPDWRPPRHRHTVVVLAHDVDAGLLEALAYAQSLSPDHLLAMSVVGNAVEAEQIEKQWSTQGIAVPLEIVHAPARDFTNATLHFVEELTHRWENTMVTVLLPELFVEHWWEQLLHNQSTLILKGRLLFRRNTAVTSIPYRRDITQTV